MHRFLHRIQNFDMYRHGHQEVHDGGVDQVPTYEIIYVRYMFYT